jgi:tRNA A37 methylthiotransferase MiaB
VPKEVKSERLTRLLAMQDEISYERNSAFLGKTLRVLATEAECREGVCLYKGKAENQKTVHFSGDGISVGNFYDIKINKIQAFDLFGERV